MSSSSFTNKSNKSLRITKKYGNRRHVKYIEEKLGAIKALWTKFLEGIGKITSLATDNQDHDYFAKRFFSNAQRAFEQYIENIQDELEKLKAMENVNENRTDDKDGGEGNVVTY